MIFALKKVCILLVVVIMSLGSVCFAATPYTYCFIGDSRFVGMKQSVETDEDIIWIAQSGASQDWYWENRDFIEHLNKNNTIIVYELGVNDLDVQGCLEALKDLENLGFKHIYFTSVTPVDEVKESQYGYSVTNANIEAFNQAVRENMPYSVASMDSYEYLSQMGVDTMDGVHYTSYTYKIWLDNILASL